MISKLDKKSQRFHYFTFFILFRHLTLGQRYNETRAKVRELIENFNIKFGVSTSAVQVEGAWNESGLLEITKNNFKSFVFQLIISHSCIINLLI